MKKISIIFTLLFSAMIFAGAANAQTNNSEDDKIYELSEVDEKPKFTKKPIPLTDGRCDIKLREVGMITLRVVLRKAGEVSDVEVIKASPCATFNENALKAAKKIKFKPAVKDGKPVSVKMQIVYTYTRY